MTGRLITTGGEGEWLAERRKGITASEIAVLMGLSPYGSPYELYHRKTGDLPPSAPDNDAMRLGRYLEDYVCERFADLYPEFIVDGNGRSLFAHPERDWQLATPDRLIQDSDTCGVAERDGVFYVEHLAVLEAKTSASYDGWGDDGSDTIPVHYRCQVLWQMDVLGVQAGYVACLFHASRKLRVYEIALDTQAQDDLSLMRAEARDFLTRIQLGDVPDVDWRPATTAALKHLHPSLRDQCVVIPGKLTAQYRAACKAVSAAKARKTLAENRIRARLGDANRAMDGTTGQTLATRQVYDVKEHTRKACTVDKLVPAPSRGGTE